MARKTKSPIRANPLRQAGESIRDEQIDLLFDKLFPMFTVVVFLWLLAGMVWIWSLNDVKPSPLVSTCLAALFTAYVSIRILPVIRKLKNLKVGYKGERVVGEYLDRLRANGYRIYHDIPGDSGNIDHVIMSTRGIYTIETKTRSKPARGQCIIRYDGNEISVNGGPKDGSPIVQAKAQAKQLRRLLKEHTGRNYPVSPIVVYPGWYIESPRTGSDTNVSVMSPKRLPTWIEEQPATISVEAIRHAATQLAHFVRKYKES